MSAASDSEATQLSFAALSHKVLALPDDKFLAAIRVLTPVTDAPEAIKLLDKARERLRELRPDRPPMLKRQLCIPFETLLHSGEPGRPGRIARRAIEPVWSFINTEGRALIDALQAEIKLLTMRDQKPLFELSVRLWQTAGKLLEKPWPDAPQDVPLLRQALASAISIEALKSVFPAETVSNFSPQTVDLVVETMVEFRKIGMPLDAFLLVTASKLDNPIKLLSIMDEKAVPVPGSIANQIDSVAIEALIARNSWFYEHAHELDDERVAQEIDRLISDIQMTRDGVSQRARIELDKRTAGAREKLRDTLKQAVLDGAAPMVTSALDGNLSIEDRVEAERRARSLRRARHAAKEIGLQPMIDACLTRIHGEINTRISASLNRLAHAGNAGTQDAAAEADFYRAIRVMELVEGNKAIIPFLDRKLSIQQKKSA